MVVSSMTRIFRIRRAGSLDQLCSLMTSFTVVCFTNDHQSVIARVRNLFVFPSYLEGETANVLEQVLVLDRSHALLTPANLFSRAFSSQLPSENPVLGKENRDECWETRMHLKQEWIGNIASWFGAVANWGPMLVCTDVEELSRSGMVQDRGKGSFQSVGSFEQKQQLRHAFKMRKWRICF